MERKKNLNIVGCLPVLEKDMTDYFLYPEEVRAETRHLINTFSRPEGKFMITMGNGATSGRKKECLQALYGEIVSGR